MSYIRIAEMSTKGSKKGGGNLGSIVLRSLLASPDLTVTALKRPGSTSVFPTSSELKVVEVDFSFDSLVSAFTDQDAVISIVGATGIGEQKVFVDAAVKAGVKRFFPSEFGINGQSDTVRQMTPFFAVKQELLDYLVEKEKDGLTWTAVIAGVLYDWCISNGFMGFDLARKEATIWDDGNTRFSGINEGDLGKSVVNILHKPAETANQFIYISSLTATQNETLESLEKVTATKWKINRVNTAQQVSAAQEALGKGDFTGALTLVKATCWSNTPGLKQHFEVDEKERLANGLLGLERGETVQDTIERVVASRN
ncbi:NAD(P)-binding protein [Tothia fuscella]|uniref:NAD(P)-binding protein n=1 Tax=Tothia fuscella TaxID=1048955 RepID=A0A9P4U019_9PEZI|nr:NAD(P)-binding protein [Tothia fuscella]